MHTHQQQISILLPELNFIPSYFEWKKSDLRRFAKDERGFLDKRDFSGEGNHTVCSSEHDNTVQEERPEILKGPAFFHDFCQRGKLLWHIISIQKQVL